MTSAEPAGFEVRREGTTQGLLLCDLADLALAELWRDGTPLAGSKGRGGVTVLTPRPGLHVVVRDYRRGGVLRALLPDRFFTRERVFREVRTLAALRAAGVRAVEPVFGIADVGGPLARLRLGTRLLEGALPLPAFCAEQPRATHAAVRAAGAVVATAFAAGLRHPDLHADNVLVTAAADGVTAWLVDLDRAHLLPRLTERDRDAMLVRFARYLVRHEADLPVRPRRTDTLAFLAGMGLGREARRAALARLVPAFQRSLARHRLSWWR